MEKMENFNRNQEKVNKQRKTEWLELTQKIVVIHLFKEIAGSGV
jgi:hypothetical protein